MMKKFISSILLAAMLIVPLPALAASSDVSYSLDYYYNNNLIMDDGVKVNTNGKIMVPLKVFADSIGASYYLNRNNMTYTIKQGNTELIFNLGDNTVKVNGKYMWNYESMDVIGRWLYVPATFLVKEFGLKSSINYSTGKLEVTRPVNGLMKATVSYGDTLYKIAQRYDTTVSWLKQQNGLTNDAIWPGQQLTVGYHKDQGYRYSAFVNKSATIKAGPGFSHSDLGYLAAWTGITVIGQNGDWYHVNSPKGFGYIHKSVMFIDNNGLGFSSNKNYFNKNLAYDSRGDYVTYWKYAVKSGDTIWSVASKHGLSESALRKANNFKTDYLTLGQTVNIPVYNIGKKTVPSYQYGEVLDWTTQGQYVFPINKSGVLIDMETGARINVKRTTGALHSDTETLSWADTQALKNAFGGKWSWERKPFILEVDGRRFAVSVSAMPHAGVDGATYLANVPNRSGDYGYGPNYDAIAGNGMDGHFDLYFLNGRRHKDGALDPQHQKSVLEAGGLQ